MTRLFNLESYVECCQYARLFAESPEQLIPPDGNNPRAYKTFLQKYAHHPYLHEPIFDASSRPSQVGWALPTSQVAPPASQVGQALPTTNQGDKQRLFIIRDTVDLMTLSMSNLLEYRDGYLYSSAYHYWNHFSEISQLKLTKPLVFVDLDSFEIQRLIPLSFIQPDNSPYKIPILDTRNPIILDEVYKPAEIYNNICRNLATRILKKHLLHQVKSKESITQLSYYLQKISFFERIQPYIQQKDLTFIVEIWWQGDIFYKQVTLPVKTIKDVVSTGINAQYLRELATNHPEYQFALISQYNVLSIQDILRDYICLKPICQHFSRIWAEKNQGSFPLFAIYLDVIEFAIAFRDNTGSESIQWLQLSNQEDAISYEGEPRTVRGRIPSINQDYFRIPQEIQMANLPIQVNGSDYRINGVPQDFSIEIQNYQGTESVLVYLDFHLTPGSFLLLDVTDLNGTYKLSNTLTDGHRITFDYIPYEKINETRYQKSLQQIQHLTSCINLETFRSTLSNINEQLNNNNSHDERLRNLLKSAYKQITSQPRSDGNIRIDPLQFVKDSDYHPAVIKLQNVFESNQPNRSRGIFNIISNLLNSSNLSKLEQSLLVTAIIFTGKTYNFSKNLSSNLSLKNLFTQNLIENAWKKSGETGKEYLQCLARIAVNEELQREYFAWFDSYYTETKYMWGYGRILFWYYDFDTSNEIRDYRKHFTQMLQHLRDGNPSNRTWDDYKKNAFLAVLYLLTFRAKDNTFCELGSEERNMAEIVIEHFKRSPIYLHQVSTEKPLNKLFQEMIEGTITETDVYNLLRA